MNVVSSLQRTFEWDVRLSCLDRVDNRPVGYWAHFQTDILLLGFSCQTPPTPPHPFLPPTPKPTLSFIVHIAQTLNMCVWERAVQISELSMTAFGIHGREKEEEVKQQQGRCQTRDITL